jgi:hypothetical protein
MSHRPSTHVPEHAELHAPQFALSLCVSTQALLQSEPPQMHAPASQSGDGWLHADASAHVPSDVQVETAGPEH